MEKSQIVSYRLQIKCYENCTLLSISVMATDRDSGLNGELEYSVSNDNFSIQTTVINNRYIGQIKVAK